MSMNLIVNILLGALIFGYAAWTIYRHFKKSKQGKCAACSMKEGCPSKKEG